MLAGWLDFHRATLEMKCAGLTPAQLATRATEPSTLSLLGLVRHMAEVERGWFRRRLGGEYAPPLYYSDDEPDGDFDNLDPATADDAFAAWRAECARAREIAAALRSLDVMVIDRAGRQPTPGADAAQGLERLTPRERDVLELVARGATNREIAGQLFLSPHTLKEHTSALYRKLGVRNRAEAVQRAERLGLTA